MTLTKKILKTFYNFKNKKNAFIDFDMLQLIFSGAIVLIVVWAGLKMYQLYKEDRIIETAIKDIENLSSFYKKQFPNRNKEINFAEKHIKSFIKNNGNKIVNCLKKEDPIICIKAFGLAKEIPINNKEELGKALKTLEELKSKLK